MLRACKYCGKIHDSKYDCGMKPKYHGKVNDKKEKFRWTKAWQSMREQIRERDNYLCQLCIRKISMKEDMRSYEYNNISVHHIIQLKDDFERRLDPFNLISVCSYHHELCENGRISKDIQFRIAREQEDKYIS